MLNANAVIEGEIIDQENLRTCVVNGNAVAVTTFAKSIGLELQKIVAIAKCLALVLIQLKERESEMK
jgi:hypothetical protein